MNIIFDLDGTLIDSSDRLYQLFQDLVPVSQLTKDEYWKLKRDKINHRMILEKLFPSVDYEEFNCRWMQLIETDNYLKLDKNYQDTIETLEYLVKENTITLLTARQLSQKLYEELDWLGITKYLERILVTEGKRSKGELLKDAIRQHEYFKCKGDAFVSDMGKDIQIGREYSYRTIAITHGFMSRNKLLDYKPDYIVDNLNEVIRVM